MEKTQDTNLTGDSSESLKKKVLVGSFWLYVLQGLSMGLLIVQTIVLARILAPEHFGIVGVFLIFSAALESFTKTGFTKALVQRKNINDDFLDTAWTVSIVRGAVLFVLIFIGSSVVVRFFDMPKALPVIRVLGFSMLLHGFSNTGTIYFSRELDFFRQFLWKSSTFLANFVISIPLAFILRNEWALVWGMLAGTLAGIVCSFVLHPYRPRFKFEYEIFKQLFHYGKWLLLSSVVVFFSKQGDKIFVTRLLGEALLGVYVIAWRFARIPELVTNPIPNALFPAYSKFQDDPETLRHKYKQTLKVIGLLYVPLVGGMIVFAKPFVSVFLGNNWDAAVLPMQILTFSMGLRIIVFTSMSLFNAMGKTSFSFKANCTSLLVLSVSAYPLIGNYGVAGAALSFLAMTLALFVVWKIEIRKLIDFRFVDMSFLLLPLLSTVFVAVLVSCMDHWLKLDHLGVLMGAVTFAGVAYFTLGCLVEKIAGLSFLQDVVGMFSLLMSGKRMKKENL